MIPLIGMLAVLVAAVFPASLAWNAGRAAVESVRNRATARRRAVNDLVAGCEAMLANVTDADGW